MRRAYKVRRGRAPYDIRPPPATTIFPRVNRRQPVFCRQVRDPFLIRISQRALTIDGESGATRLSRLFECALVFVGAADFHGMKLQTQFSCRQLAFFPLLRRAWILWIPKHRNAGELGNGFLE